MLESALASWMDFADRPRPPWPLLRRAAAKVLRLPRAPTSEQSNPARRQVLLVGGEADHRRFCETILRELGVAVQIAETCETGARLIAAKPYALVIVDERTRDFSAALWAHAVRTAARRGEIDQTRFYIVGEAATLAELARLGFRARCGRLARPIGALNLVRAIARLAR